jgi:hypothetical protein
MATETLARLLREHAGLGPVRDRLAKVRRLERRYRAIAPATLASASRVCAIDGTTVVIRADNAPVAAALRALAPRLLEGLRKSGPATKNTLKNKGDQELTALRVEIQVEPPAMPRKLAPRQALPLERLATLARGLSDSPLKETLERIAGAQRKSSTRSKT